MRVFLSALILIFSLQSWTKADDITDFQIEGVSVGDSLLDYLSKELIENEKNSDSAYKDNEYFRVWYDGKGKFKTYDYLQIHLKANDAKYIIQSLEGKIIYKDNIKDCYSQKNIIYNELKELFPTAKVKNVKSKHTADTSGKSLTDSTYLILPNDKGNFGVACYDYSKEFGKIDNLKVFIDTAEFLKWLNTKAYK